MGKNIKMTDGPVRKRGRPRGKNRIPLSKKERLARNALYERERREEIAEAMADLADAMGCDRDMRQADLLPAAIQYIQLHAARINQMADVVDSLRSKSQHLIERIRYLKQRHPMQPQDYHTMGMHFAGKYPEDKCARTRGYMGRPATIAVPLVSVEALDVKVDPQPIKAENEEPWIEQPAAVEYQACGHRLFSVECLEQCMGMGAEGGSPKLPQAAAMDVDLEEELFLSTESNTTLTLPPSERPTETATTTNGTILPSDIKDFILEYTSWGRRTQ